MDTYVAGQTIDFKFRTEDSAGAPTTLSGGAVSIYRGNSATQFTTGVTLTADFDSTTGLNHVRIVTTDAAYAPGADFEAVITAGTVDGVSWVGKTVHRFRLTKPQTFYVDPANGSDSNDGLTPATAFATIAGAVPGTYGGALVAARAAGGKTLIKCFPTGDQVERNVIDLRSTATGNPPIDLDITGCRLRCMPTWNANSAGITFTAASVVASGGTATASFNCKDLSHYFKTGDTVTITGLSPAGLNGTKTITVVNAIQLTYSTAASDGAGTGTGSFNKALPTAQVGSCITLADGCEVTAYGARVDCAAGQGTTTTFGASAGIYASAIGVRSATHTSARSYRVRGGMYVGNTDSFFDSSIFTPTSPDGYEQFAIVEDAAFIARADAFVVDNLGSHVIGRRLFISTFGPSDIDNWTTDSRACVVSSGRLDLEDSVVIAQNATQKTYAVRVQDGNSELHLSRTRLSSISSAGDIYDIIVDGASAKCVVHACEYDSAKTATSSSGTITIVPTHGGDVRQAAGTNWNSGAIGASTLASDTITSAKIADNAITAAKLAADVTDELQDGIATLTITPLVASVANPFYATRDLPKLPAASANTIVWTITDGNGAAVNLSGKTIRLVAYLTTSAGDNVDSVIDDTIAASFQYATSGDGITVGGADNNQITLVHSITKTATPGDFRYMLWNITDNTLLAKGKMPIEPSVKGS